MSNDKVDLQIERSQTDELLKRFQESFVPLPVAAATTFHQAHGNTNAIIRREDYDDALNIAAAALSRLVPIYSVLDPRDGRTPVTPDLTQQYFARGATELRSRDATAPLRELSIRRSDMLSAISLIKRTGLPFSFALTATPLHEELDPGQTRPAEAGHRDVKG
jgi:hypothetical protein